MIITISNREKRVSKQKQQAGIVSIIVATMLIIIVSLIVVAFAQVSRREQRESLDAQLSSQAYYAAETGVNAARGVVDYLLANNPAALSTPQKLCQPTSGDYQNIPYDLDPAHDVAITCLTVDPNPTNLTYDLSTNASTVVPIFPDNGATINSITITWDKSNTNSTAGCQIPAAMPTLPTEATWNNTWKCPYAGIRADILPMPNATATNISRDYLLTNDKVSFILPSSGGTGSGNPAPVMYAACDDGSSTCKVTFSGLGYPSMYLRLVSLYQGAKNVTITGSDGAIPLKFTKAQAKIDSTGRAQDVLRRIVVSAPLQGGGGTGPVQALVSGDSVCKRAEVFTNFYKNQSPLGSGCE